ncbi:MAG: hypothetical protein ABSA83_08620 [Verrucomicrobiota bacterium]|jgi:hypothetical protein
MARFDSSNNDYERGFTFQEGGRFLFLDTIPMLESSGHAYAARLLRAKPIPKKGGAKRQKFFRWAK